MSGKIVDNKEVVAVENALDYVKKQGYIIITPEYKRVVQVMTCLFLVMGAMIMLPNFTSATFLINKIDQDGLKDFTFFLNETVNASEYWITNEGSLDNIPDTYPTLDGRYALNSEVVTLIGDETITGRKIFNAKQEFIQDVLIQGESTTMFQIADTVLPSIYFKVDTVNGIVSMPSADVEVGKTLNVSSYGFFGNNVTVDGVVIADDFVTASKVWDDNKRGNSAMGLLKNPTSYLNANGSLNYESHPAYFGFNRTVNITEVRNITEEIFNEELNLTETINKSVQVIVGNKTIEQKGLSMQERVIMLEKQNYQLTEMLCGFTPFRDEEPCVEFRGAN